MLRLTEDYVISRGGATRIRVLKGTPLCVRFGVTVSNIASKPLQDTCWVPA